MPKQAATPITLNSVVPHTKFTYGQLCRVRRCYGGRLAPGLLLAKHGAWDRKAVVSAVTYLGPLGKHKTQAGFVYQLHAFTVEILPLGNVYATGKIKPPARGQKPVERYLECGEVVYPQYHLSGWVVVEPVNPAVGLVWADVAPQPVIVPPVQEVFAAKSLVEQGRMESKLTVDPHAPDVRLGPVQQLLKAE